MTLVDKYSQPYTEEEADAVGVQRGSELSGSMLISAVHMGHLEVTKNLLALGVDPNFVDVHGMD
jgi:hypothetical protein